MESRGECHVIHLESQECLRLPKLGERPGTDSPLEFSEGGKPDVTLTWGF